MSGGKQGEKNTKNPDQEDQIADGHFNTVLTAFIYPQLRLRSLRGCHGVLYIVDVECISDVSGVQQKQDTNMTINRTSKIKIQENS